MIRKSTWIILGIFALSLAAVWALQGPAKGLVAEPTATAEPEVLLLELAEEEVQALQVELAGGQIARLERGLDDAWVLVEPQAEATDVTAAGLTVSQLSTLRVIARLESAPPEETSGLAAPQSTITVELKDGATRTITVGGATPVGSGYYVRLDGDPQVYAVEQSGIDFLNELASSPPVVPAETPTLEETGGPAGGGPPQGETPQGGTPTPAATP